MRRPVLFLFLAFALAGLATACTTGAPEPGPVTSLLALDPTLGQLPEGIAADADGLYVGIAVTSQVVRVSYDGAMSNFGQLPALPPNGGFMTGLALDKDGNVFVGLASFVAEVPGGIYRIPAGGGRGNPFCDGRRIDASQRACF